MTLSPYTIILAGGQGRRMGGVDKGAINLGARRMVDEIVSRLEAQGARMKISGQAAYGLDIETIPDVTDGPKGPVAGLYAAYQHFEKSGETGFFTVPVDGPNLPHDLLSRLYDTDASTIAEDDAGRHPVFGWWRLYDLRAVWADIDMTQSISMKRLAEMVGAKCVRWPSDACFVNINSDDDLKTYLSQV